jgi:hypothetical protein
MHFSSINLYDMKMLFLTFSILITGVVKAQNNTYPVKGIPAVVTHWGSLSIWLGSDFFSETRDSIITQIGEDEFDWMKSRCSSSGWPKGLYLSSLDEAEDKIYEERLGRLKKYRIASFQHIYHGVRYDRYVILRIPYDENSKWDESVQWEKSLYFIIKEDDTRQVSHL